MLEVLLAAAALAAPAGFTESATLNARAAWVAQKPVHIYCPQTDQAWQDFLSANNDAAQDVHGVTLVVGGDEAYMDGDGCATIDARIRKHPIPLEKLGAVLLALTHESFHMRGESDEGQTECDAIRTLPAFLVAKWGFRRNSGAFRQVMYGAWNFHRRLAPQYRMVC